MNFSLSKDVFKLLPYNHTIFHRHAANQKILPTASLPAELGLPGLSSVVSTQAGRAAEIKAAGNMRVLNLALWVSASQMLFLLLPDTNYLV